MKERISFNLNAQSVEVDVDPTTPLLYALRDQLGLNGPKYGCGLQQCGACSALIDGEARPTCRLPVAAVKGSKVVTIEGLEAEDGTLHPLQEAMIEQQAAQCGYCLNGMLIAGAALLERNPEPDRNAINEGMRGSLCRCGTYGRFVRAIRSASDKIKTRNR